MLCVKGVLGNKGWQFIFTVEDLDCFLINELHLTIVLSWPFVTKRGINFDFLVELDVARLFLKQDLYFAILSYTG